MKIRYLLKKKSTEFLIYVALYQGEGKAIISTGQRTTRAAWSAKDNAPKDQRGSVARAIEKVKLDVQKTILRLELDGEDISPNIVKNAYLRAVEEEEVILDRKDIKAKKDATLILTLAERWRDKELFRYRSGTQKAVKSSINKFIAFLQENGYAKLRRHNFEQAIVDDYDRVLTKTKPTDNTHGKLMKHLRWFLKYAGLKADVRVKSVRKTIVSLTVAEVDRLEALEIKDSTEKEKAKDLFLLGCFTGLRVSDLKRINPINTKDGFITLNQMKNRKDVRIPIVSNCLAILQKYKFKAPKIAEQKVNDHIKEICAAAKINEMISVETHRGGEKIVETGPKYKFVTMHVSAKSFITTAPQRWGLTPAEIADLVGKDLRTLLNHYFNNKGESGRQKMIEVDNRSKMKAIS